MSDETMAELVRQVQEEHPLLPGGINWPDTDPFEVERVTLERCNQRLTEQRQKYEKEIIFLQEQIKRLLTVSEELSRMTHDFLDSK